jgi:hypothetical protein
LVAGAACAQSLAPEAPKTSDGSLQFVSLELPDAPVSVSAAVSARAASVAAPVSSTGNYIRPTADQRFHDYVENAVGPVAFAGAAVSGAIDQGLDFQKAWGQGWNAYGVRVASNLGISMVAATTQYGLAEAFHEDTAYYHCTCTGFGRRFAHAAISSVTARRGDDGHRVFSLAMTVSPFVGPMVAANAWIPTHNGPHLGLVMGEHNLLGQFAQDEALEFLYGGPHTVGARLQKHFKRFSLERSDAQ